MLYCLKVLVSLCLLFSEVFSQCTFANSGYTLNLASLMGQTFTWTDSTNTFKYSWTPCNNGLTCTNTGSGTASVMASQSNLGNGNCNNIAVWDSGSIQGTYDAGTQTWSLSYNNGAICSGAPRNLRLNLLCSSSGTNKMTSVNNPSGTCEYDYYLTGPGFCATGGGSSGGGSSGGGSSGGGGGGLSGGWVFIIILLVVFFLYCTIGYAYNKTKVHPDSSWGDVKTNTPHLDFWCNIPKWTWAGCCVTKEFIASKIGSKSEAHAPIAGNDTA